MPVDEFFRKVSASPFLLATKRPDLDPRIFDALVQFIDPGRLVQLCPTRSLLPLEIAIDARNEHAVEKLLAVCARVNAGMLSRATNNGRDPNNAIARMIRAALAR
jgi:hypothetical protein